MKVFLFFAFFVAVAGSACSSKKKSTAAAGANCFKGRLEIKGGCMNYTIGVIEGGIDTSLVQASWTDENTGKSYSNVFALESRCDFPANINQGDSFYFTIDSSSKQDCAVCLMYYPVPAKKLSIKVRTEPCTR